MHRVRTEVSTELARMKLAFVGFVSSYRVVRADVVHRTRKTDHGR